MGAPSTVPGPPGTNGLITSVVGSTYITVNNATPSAPIISATGLVAKTGDTMTGQLLITGTEDGTAGGSNLVLRNPVIGREGGQLRLVNGDNWATGWNLDIYDSTFRIFNGGGVRLTVTDGGIIVGGAMNFATYGGGWNMTDNTYIRSTSDKHVWLGAGWFGANGGMSLGNNGTTNNGYMLDVNGSVRTGTITTMANYKIWSNGSDGGAWNSKGVISQIGSGNRTGYSLHPGGTAKQWAMAPNDGGLFAHNEDGTWYADLWCNTVNQASSIRGKTDIAAWPPKSAGSAVMDACNRLSLIDVMSYRIKPECHLIDADSMVDGQVTRLHDCDIDPCDGTSDDPCNRVKDQQNPHIGIIIEDLATVLPEAVSLDLDGNPGALRMGTMLGYLLAVCKEQQERIEALEHQSEAA
jgi:hypothetical protein